MWFEDTGGLRANKTDMGETSTSPSRQEGLRNPDIGVAAQGVKDVHKREIARESARKRESERN